MDTEEIVESGVSDDVIAEYYDEKLLNGDLDLSAINNIEIRPELKKIYQQHPECILDYIENTIPKLDNNVKTDDPDYVDPCHKTYPFLTLYEKTKIIGLRANQLSQGAQPFISVPSHVTDVKDIARLELEQKRIPVIIKRPLPNGSFEYWRLSDLMIL